MKKINKIILSSVAALSLLVSATTPTAIKAEEDTQNVEQRDDVSINALALKPGQLLGLGYKILKYGANTWLFHPEATEYSSDTALEISSGKIGFNNKGDSGYGASAKHDVVVSSTEQQIHTFAETDFVNMFTAKIAVIITDPKNNDVVSKTLTHEQHVLHNPTKNGTYSIRYVDENKLNWNLYIYLTNYQINPSSLNSSITLDGLKTPALYKDGKIYIYPSENHKKSISTKLVNNLSLKDLQLQFYDETLQRNVRDLRDFNIGDSISFEDTISSIDYDNDKNYTLLGFKDIDGDIVNWVFKGDLTSSFKVGDSLRLKLHVVEETNGFENIDLIKNFQDSGEVAEEIDKYLIK